MQTPQLPLTGANINRLTSKIRNSSGYRVTNTADAIDPQDCVTLSQLEAALAGKKLPVTESTGGTPYIPPPPTAALSQEFFISVPGTLSVGNDLAARLFIVNTFTPTTFRADVKTAPVGADLIIKIYVEQGIGTPHTSTNLAGTITIPDGLSYGTSTSLTISGSSYVKLNITQVGSSTAGADLVVCIQ